MDKTMQNELCLSVKQTNHYRCGYAPLNYPKPICTEFPRSKLTGMVLHRKLMVPEGSNTRLFITCTILTERGEIHATYKEFPFPIDLVVSQIIKFSNKIVIEKIPLAQSGNGLESFGLPTTDSIQRTLHMSQHLSQLSQISQMNTS